MAGTQTRDSLTVRAELCPPPRIRPPLAVSGRPSVPTAGSGSDPPLPVTAERAVGGLDEISAPRPHPSAQPHLAA